jgi:hypothetical protein
MTQASPLLAYLQAMQQGRQQNEQMRQQFGLQNLEQQKNNAQFLMELADRKESREQQRKQFQWQQNEENRRTLAEGQAVADRVRALEEAKNKHDTDVSNYINTKTTPLQTAFNNVVSLRKQVEKLATGGQRYLPSQIKLLQQELAKAEGNHAAALQLFGNTITGDTAYGIDWNKIQGKYALPEWQLPSAFTRRSTVVPGNITPTGSPAAALTGQGPLNVKSQGGVSDEELETNRQLFQPTGVDTSGIGLPISLTGNFVGAGFDPLNAGIKPPPKASVTYAPPAKPIPVIDPITALTALRKEYSDKIPGGAWDTSELSPEQGKAIADLVTAYFTQRGTSFRPAKFNDTIYGSDISGILNEYQKHVGDKNAVAQFLAENMFGDNAELSPNVIERIASRLTDKGYIDPSVLGRLAEESSKARSEAIKQQQLDAAKAEAERAKKEEARKVAKFNLEMNPDRIKRKDEFDRLQNLKLSKDIAEIGKPVPGKPINKQDAMDKALDTWRKNTGLKHIDDVIDSIQKDLEKLPTHERVSEAIKKRRNDLRSAASALRDYRAQNNYDSDEFVNKAIAQDVKGALAALKVPKSQWDKFIAANPVLNGYYKRAEQAEVRLPSNNGSNQAGDND